MGKEVVSSLSNDGLWFPVKLHGEGYNQVVEYLEVSLFEGVDGSGEVKVDPMKAKIEKLGEESENGFWKVKVIDDEGERVLFMPDSALWEK